MVVGMDVRRLAARLLSLAVEGEPIDIEVRSDFFSDEEDQHLMEMHGVVQTLVGPAEQLVYGLQQELSASGWLPDNSSAESGQDNWTFGTALTFRRTRQRIHGGYMQPIRRVPILKRVPEQVVLYLLTVDRGEDYLERETHGMGWHYHYLDWKERRSDVILSWDTRWSEPAAQTKRAARRGLFSERHAEKGKGFQAKPWLWGPRKRLSVYEACAADLARRKIEEYRCAADKAEVVYPADAILTPRSP